MTGFLETEDLRQSLIELKDALELRIYRMALITGIDPETIDITNPPDGIGTVRFLNRLCRGYLATIEKLGELDAQ